jgi:hypothetical protein
MEPVQAEIEAVLAWLASHADATEAEVEEKRVQFKGKLALLQQALVLACG